MNRIADILKSSFVIKIPVWLLVAIGLLLYPAWEYYWYTKVGLAFIKWHTHLAVYFYLWIICVCCFGIAGFKARSGKAGNILLLFSAVMFSLMLTELYLQVSGTYKTQFEKDNGFYRSPYIATDKTWYHTWPSTSKEHWLQKPEFRFWRPTNAMGLPDVEWPREKPSGQVRIMALGDSFTEGDGAAFDSSYVAFLRRKLNATGHPAYLMNAGVCASDPFNNYLLLKDSLLAYKPDIVIQVIETNDINTDIILRGGLERFQKNGHTQFHSAPWWEPLYAISYVSRIFFEAAGYNELLLKNTITPQQQKSLNNKVVGLFAQYAALCKQNNIRLCVVLLPCKGEVEQNKYDYDFTEISNRLKTTDHVPVFNLLPAYKAYMAQNHTSPKQYYWTRDGHHNAKGYQMMADCIYDSFIPAIDSVFLALTKKN